MVRRVQQFAAIFLGITVFALVLLAAVHEYSEVKHYARVEFLCDELLAPNSSLSLQSVRFVFTEHTFVLDDEAACVYFKRAIASSRVPYKWEERLDSDPIEVQTLIEFYFETGEVLKISGALSEKKLVLDLPQFSTIRAHIEERLPAYEVAIDGEKPESIQRLIAWASNLDEAFRVWREQGFKEELKPRFPAITK